MLNKTQLEYVKEVLENKGNITRNEALKNYISRLGALICILKDKGYEFKGEYIKVKTPFGVGKDYKYTLIKKGDKND